MIVGGVFGVCYKNILKDMNGRKFMVSIISFKIGRSFVGNWS